MTTLTKRGRPPLVKALTIEQRIAALVATGYRAEEIAVALEMTVSELKRAYYALLADGARIARAEVITAMFSAAVTGNAAAGKAFLAISSETKPESGSKPETKPQPKENRKHAPWGARRERETQEARDLYDTYPEWSFAKPAEPSE